MLYFNFCFFFEFQPSTLRNNTQARGRKHRTGRAAPQEGFQCRGLSALFVLFRICFVRTFISSQNLRWTQMCCARPLPPLQSTLPCMSSRGELCHRRFMLTPAITTTPYVRREAHRGGFSRPPASMGDNANKTPPAGDTLGQ